MNSPAADPAVSPATLRATALAVKAIAIVGVALFGTILLLVTLAPGILEGAAHGYMSQRLHAEIQSLVGGSVEAPQLIDDPELVQRYAGQLSAGSEEVRAALTKLVDRLVACVCKHDCAARAKARILFDAIVAAMSDDMRAAVLNIQAIAQGRFEVIFAKLRHELTLISLINASIFAALFVVVWLGKARGVIIVPAALLAGSTLITAGLYFFGRNWWWAVLTDGYWGMGYLAVAGVVAMFLCDSLFFEGRVAAGLIDGLGDAFSALAAKC